MVAPSGGAQLGKSVLELTTDDARFNRGLDAAHRRASGVFSSIGKLGAAAFVGIGAAAAGGITAAVMQAANVEQRLDVLQTTAGATGDEMARLSRHAKALGADISLPGTSAADAAEAMLELSKAGLTVDNVYNGVRGTLQLSAAGQLSNAEAAEITANALNAFSLSGSEATRIADLLAASANASSASVQDVGLSLKQSAALAASAGIPIEDLVTGIGQLANAGIKGSDAGTSLRAMLLHLQAPAETTSKLMREIGLDVYDASGNMNSLREIIAATEAATRGMTQEERDFTLATIFGADAVRAINVLLAQGTAGFDKMKDATTRQGAAAQLAAAYNRGLKGAIDAVKSSAETLAVTIGTPLLKGLADFARGVAGAIGEVEELGGRFMTGWRGGEFVEAIEGPRTAAFQLGERVREAYEWLDRLRGLAPNFGQGAATGLGIIRDVAADARDRVQEVYNLIRAGDWQGAGAAVANGLKAGLGGGADLAQGIGTTLSEAVGRVDWANLGRESFKAAVPFIAGFVMALLDPVAWAQIIAQNKLLTAEVLLTIIFAPGKWAAAVARVLGRLPLAGPILAWFLTHINSLGAPIRGKIDEIVTLWGHGLVDAIRNGITNRGGAFLQTVLDLPAMAAQALRSKADDFALEGGVWIERLGAGIGRGINTVLGAFGQLADDVIAGTRLYAERWVQIGIDIVRGIARGITRAGPEAVGAIGGMVGGLIAKARGLLDSESPSRVFMDIGADVMSGFAIGITQNAEEAAKAMADAVDGIRATLRDEQIGAYFAGPEALAAMRAQHAIMLVEAGRLADDLQNVFGLDDVTAMDKALTEMMRRRDAALAAEPAVNAVADRERAELAERLASVGRLMPRMEPRPGAATQTFEITIPISIDPQGRYDSRELAAAIGNQVIPRLRETLAEAR